MNRWIAGLALVFLAAGCKTFQAPFGRLESAVVNDRYTNAPSRAAVRVVRGDSIVTPALSMRIRVGDSIITARDTRVVLTFSAGYEVTLDTNTVLFIDGPTGAQAGSGETGRGTEALGSRAMAPLGGAPRAGTVTMGLVGGPTLSMPADSNSASFFLRIGRAFIKHIRGKPDTLDTRTPQATLHEEGTEYVVTVDGSGTILRVVTGIVRAEGLSRRWSIRYREREGGFLQTGQQPQTMPTLSSNELEAELSWVRRVERVTRVDVPSLNGLTESQARSALSRAGLQASLYVSRPNNDAPAGTVIDQSPSAGARVQPNSDVTLTVSKGPKAVTGGAPAARQCTVPAITGRRQAEALRLLAAAGLKGSGTRNDNGVDDVVTSQSVNPQQQVNCDVVVKFNYGTIVR